MSVLFGYKCLRCKRYFIEENPLDHRLCECLSTDAIPTTTIYENGRVITWPEPVPVPQHIWM